jgi:hypothetical protein
MTGEKKLTLCRKEFDDLAEAVAACPMFKEEVAKLNIPDGFEVIVEPWPYGGKYISDLNTIGIFHSMQTLQTYVEILSRIISNNA